MVAVADVAWGTVAIATPSSIAFRIRMAQGMIRPAVVSIFRNANAIDAVTVDWAGRIR